LDAALATVPTRRYRVLIVEDHDPTAHALAAAMTELGHEVAIAHDGPVALVIARAFRPEIALLDIGLPVMDGWDLAARLRELSISPRFIAVTGRSSDMNRRHSASAGFVEHS